MPSSAVPCTKGRRWGWSRPIRTSATWRPLGAGHPGCRWSGSATACRSPTPPFDSVSMLDVLEHTVDERATLVEVHRVLRPGGLLVLTVPARYVFSFLDPDNAKFRFPRLHRAVYSARFGSPTYAAFRRRLRRPARRHGVGPCLAHELRADDRCRAPPGSLARSPALDGANLFWRFLQVPALLAPRRAQRLFDAPLRADGRLFRRANLFMTAVPPGHRPARARMSSPDFIYIGPDKAGSSWLHEVLLEHPQVFLTPAKGLYFFDRYYDRGLPWYVSQFDAARDRSRSSEARSARTTSSTPTQPGGWRSPRSARRSSWSRCGTLRTGRSPPTCTC